MGEPSLTTALLGKQGVQGARALGRCGSSVPQQHSASKVCSVLPHEFGVVRLYRTFSNDIFPGKQVCRVLMHSLRTLLALHCCGSRRFEEVRCA